MRSILRFALLVVAVTLAWNWSWLQRPSARQETERLITLRVEPSPLSRPMFVAVTEGYAVQVQWAAGDALTRFALRPSVIDDDGSVHIAVESAGDGRPLDALVRTVGAPASDTNTMPPLRVQVVRVEQR